MHSIFGPVQFVWCLKRFIATFRRKCYCHANSFSCEYLRKILFAGDPANISFSFTPNQKFWLKFQTGESLSFTHNLFLVGYKRITVQKKPVSVRRTFFSRGNILIFDQKQTAWERQAFSIRNFSWDFLLGSIVKSFAICWSNTENFSDTLSTQTFISEDCSMDRF